MCAVLLTESRDMRPQLLSRAPDQAEKHARSCVAQANDTKLRNTQGAALHKQMIRLQACHGGCTPGDTHLEPEIRVEVESV